MARMRSPNFPGLSLEDAIKAVKSIWDKNRLAPISREAAAKDLGYSGLTGRSLKVLGAMNQHGLIDNVSKGQVRVTQTAQDILIGFPEAVKRAAITKAGHTPSLYQGIYDRFEGAIPGENAVRFFLLQNGFTNEGVEKALRNFADTNRYVEMYGDSESYEDATESDSESAPAPQEPETKVAAAPAPQHQEPTPQGGVTFWHKGPLDFNLSSSGLAVVGKTNSAQELKAFIQKLQALASLLPE